MDLLLNLTVGFEAVLTPANLIYCLLGCVIGTLIGVLPGIGPTAAVALLLPVTMTLPPISSLIMLSGIYYGSQYGGSTTAILINLPGESSSAVTTIDGYQMARRGRAGPALAAAAVGSFVAGTIATLLIAAFAAPLTFIAFQFGPAEYFALMVLGLVSSVALARGSLVKAIGMIVLGILLGLIGRDINSGIPRFTFGFYELDQGLDFIALAVGLFGISEILKNLEAETEREPLATGSLKLFPSRDDLRRIVGPTLRGTAIGSVLGILPGGGALLSSFAAYAIEKKVSPNGHEFGQGAIEGVAAPESANNAGAQTSFIPMLTLGIPSNPVMALMIAAMIIQGVVPGPNVATQNPDLFWGIIVSMWIGNFFLVILNLPLIGIWTTFLRVPYRALVPVVLIFCCIGVYSTAFNVFSLYLISAAGLAGYLLARLGCEPAPLVLGFILGPQLEEYLRRAMVLARGDLTELVTRPISAGLLILSVLTLVLVALPAISRKRDEVFVDE